VIAVGQENMQTGSSWLGYTDYFACSEGFIGFVTSDIPDEDTISSAILSLWLATDISTDAEFTVQVRVHDYGSSLSEADWVAGADLSSKTLLATKATSGIGSTGEYKDFTSETAFASNVSKTGSTRMLLCSSRHVAGNQPGSQWRWYEAVHFSAADETGTTYDPKLVVVHASSGQATPVNQSSEADTAPSMATFGKPRNLVATIISENRVDLSWNAVTGATAYEVFRDGVHLDTVLSNSYSDQSISSHSHRWQVRTVK
jgi:hypothetical protein